MTLSRRASASVRPDAGSYWHTSLTLYPLTFRHLLDACCVFVCGLFAFGLQYALIIACLVFAFRSRQRLAQPARLLIRPDGSARLHQADGSTSCHIQHLAANALWAEVRLTFPASQSGDTLPTATRFIFSTKSLDAQQYRRLMIYSQYLTAHSQTA